MLILKVLAGSTKFLNKNVQCGNKEQPGGHI